MTVTRERLMHIANDDVAASIALTRDNIRRGVRAQSCVPYEHSLVVLDACFDVWPDGAYNTFSPRNMLFVWMGFDEESDAMDWLLPCGERVRTRRRLAVALCNMWRRVPSPHPMLDEDHHAIAIGVPNPLHLGHGESPMFGHALVGYVDELMIAAGGGWFDWLVSNVDALVGSYVSPSDGVGCVSFIGGGSVYREQFMGRHVHAHSDFDASRLPVVPLSVAGGIR